MLRFLQTVGWLACIIYSSIPSFWLIIHPRIEYWRARSRSPYRVLVPLWLLMWIILGAITWPWRHVQLYRTPLSWIPAVALFACGILLYRAGGRRFSREQLGGRPELEPARHEQRLVTTGIRSRVRHPIYLAHFCEIMGWSIGTGLAVCFALAVFAIITGVFMLRVEDRELEQRFGDEYREYRRRVPAILLF